MFATVAFLCFVLGMCSIGLYISWYRHMRTLAYESPTQFPSRGSRERTKGFDYAFIAVSTLSVPIICILPANILQGAISLWLFIAVLVLALFTTAHLAIDLDRRRTDILIERALKHWENTPITPSRIVGDIILPTSDYLEFMNTAAMIIYQGARLSSEHVVKIMQCVPYSLGWYELWLRDHCSTPQSLKPYLLHKDEDIREAAIKRLGELNQLSGCGV